MCPAVSGEVDRRADRGGGTQRRERALLAEILQQHRAAQRIADRDDAVVGKVLGQLPQHPAEIGGAADMIVLAAIGARGTAAAQVEAQHTIAAVEQQARGTQDVRAVLAAGEAVDQDRERPARAAAPPGGRACRAGCRRCGRPCGKHTRSLVCGARSVAELRRSTATVCRSAPHQGKRGRNGGRSRESMDGGTSNSVFTVVLAMKTPALRQSSGALGALCAIGAAAVFSTAGVIVRRIDLPAWDVSFWRSALLVLAILPLLCLAAPRRLDRRPQRRRSPCSRAPSCWPAASSPSSWPSAWRRSPTC